MSKRYFETKYLNLFKISFFVNLSENHSFKKGLNNASFTCPFLCLNCPKCYILSGENYIYSKGSIIWNIREDRDHGEFTVVPLAPRALEVLEKYLLHKSTNRREINSFVVIIIIHYINLIYSWLTQISYYICSTTLRIKDLTPTSFVVFYSTPLGWNYLVLPTISRDNQFFVHYNIKFCFTTYTAREYICIKVFFVKTLSKNRKYNEISFCFLLIHVKQISDPTLSVLLTKYWGITNTS